MDDIEEKRVYTDRVGKTELLVAAALGIVSVELSGDRVGRFSITHRCGPVDVAAEAGLVAVATPTDVLVRDSASDSFEDVGFGPAEAIGIDEGVVAADTDGRIAKLSLTENRDRRDPVRTDDWVEIGELAPDVRGIDPPFVATSRGVHRLPGLDYVGLDDVYDVAPAGPLVATGDGLYSLGNGWMDELDGEFMIVGSDGNRTHAATAAAFYERRGGEWNEVNLSTGGSVVDVVYGAVTYAITDDGVLFAGDGDEWRAHPLGVDGVVGCTIG